MIRGEGLVAATLRNFAALPDSAKEAAIIAGLLVAGGIIFYYLHAVRKLKAKPGIRHAFAYVFDKRLYGHVTTRTDIKCFFLIYGLWFPVMRTMLAVVAGVISVTVSYDTLAGLFGARRVLIGNETAGLLFQFATIFLSAEFCSYWTHRAFHRIPLLWSLHRVHHSAEAMTIFTRLRQHPLDLIITALGKVVLPGTMAGAIFFITGSKPSVAALTVYYTAGAFIPYGLDVWRHSHIPISLGRLNYLINAPVMHQIHHSAETRHFDKNLGAELMIFDWLFGTLYVPEADEKYRWGLNARSLAERNPHATFTELNLEPFRYARQVVREKKWVNRADDEARHRAEMGACEGTA